MPTGTSRQALAVVIPDSQKIARQDISGVLLLDKPAGLSSTSALGRAKFLMQAKKGGHTGTLDPFATGLLPLCFGEATKFARFMLDANKRYCATLQLGATSTTGDTEGEISVGRRAELPREFIQRVLTEFIGPQQQVPPMHSALKVDGVPLYKLARKGVEIERVARSINIEALSVLDWDESAQRLVIDAAVSKGTYIRVLAEDIGRALGCGAFLVGLRRTVTGGFAIGASVTLDALAAMSLESRRTKLLLPEALCGALSAIHLSEEDARIFCHGGWVSVPEPACSGEFRVLRGNGEFLGVGAVVSSVPGAARLTPTRLMSVESP